MALGQFHSSSFDPSTVADAVTGLLPAQTAQRVTEPAVYQVRETVSRIKVQTVNDAEPALGTATYKISKVYIGPDASSVNNKTLAAYVKSINDQWAASGRYVIWNSSWTFTDLSKGGVPRGYFNASYRLANGTYTLGWRDLLTGEDLSQYDRLYTVSGTKTQDRWPEDGEDLKSKTLVTIRAATVRYLYPGENAEGKTLSTYTYKAAQTGYVPQELPLTFQNSHWMTAKLSSDQTYTADRIAYNHINDMLQFRTSSGCCLSGDGAIFGIAGETGDNRIAVALTKLSSNGHQFTVTMEPVILDGIPSGRVLRMVPISTNRCAILTDLYVGDGFQYAVFFLKNLHTGNPVILKSTLLELTPGPEAELTAADMSVISSSMVWVVIRDRNTGYAKSFNLTSPS